MLWNERNNRLFEGKNSTAERLINNVKETVWSWTLGNPSLFNTSLEDVIFKWDTLISS